MAYALPVLSERIELWTLETRHDGMGGYLEQWQYVVACWASVQWLGSTSLSLNTPKDDLKTEGWAGRYRFMMRKQPLPSPLRILWHQHTFGLSSDLIDLGAHFLCCEAYDLRLERNSYQERLDS